MTASNNPMDNTTLPQDHDIASAQRNASSLVANVGALIDIIAGLDLQITRWKKAAQCDTPDELKQKLRS